MGDVQAFVRGFLRDQQRRLMQQEPGLHSFKTPESLAKERGIRPRYERVAFDRDVLREHADADFMAFGHPLFDRMIAAAKEFGFAGYMAKREVRDAPHTGAEGLQLNYLLTVEQDGRRKERFLPVFVDSAGGVRDDLAEALKSAYSAGELAEVPAYLTDAWVEAAFTAATARAEQALTTLRTGEPEEIANLHAVNGALVRFVE